MIFVVFQWNVSGLFPVDAQTAGEELDRIYKKNGKLDPSDIVEESKNKTAPLHDCFEWDDKVAAEKYRIKQAGDLVRCIVTVMNNENGKEPVKVRAFVHVESNYTPIEVVSSKPEMMDLLLKAAISELNSFQKKYSNLQELSRVFGEIQRLNEYIA